MIRRIEKADKEIYMEFAKDFYSSDAVDHTVPESHFEAAFNEFFRASDYLEGYILEYESKPVGYGIISKTFSPEAGGVSLPSKKQCTYTSSKSFLFANSNIANKCLI